MQVKCLLQQYKKSSLGQRFAKGAFWSVLGNGLSRGLSLVAFIFVARIIGKEQYGELGIIRSTINLFVLFAGMGLSNTTSKYIAQYRNTNPQKAYDIYTLSLFLSVISTLIVVVTLIIFAPSVAANSLKAPYLANTVRVGSVVVLLAALNAIQSGSLFGFEKFKELAVNNLMGGIVEFVLLIIAGYFWGVEGCIWALGLSRLCMFVLNRLSINKITKCYNFTTRFRQERSNYAILWKFSLPALFSSLLTIPVLWWARTYLISNSNYGEMAVFDVADQWSAMILFLPGIIASILLPFLSNTLEEGTKQQYVKLVRYNIYLNGGISLTLAIIVAAISWLIMKMYGEGFDNPFPLIIMAVTAVPISICNVVGQTIASQDKMWQGFLFNLIWAVWVVLFSHLLIQMGAVGLALAIFLSYCLHFAAQMVYIHFQLKNNK